MSSECKPMNKSRKKLTNEYIPNAYLMDFAIYEFRVESYQVVSNWCLLAHIPANFLLIQISSMCCTSIQGVHIFLENKESDEADP